MDASVVDLIEEYQSVDIKSLNHSRLIHRISVALERYDDQYDVMPELELELNDKKVKPDISVYPNLKIDWQNDVMFYDVPPLIAIEILSPKQAVSDLTEKAYKIYLPSGVQSVWIIIPTMKILQIITLGSTETITNGLIKDTKTGIEITMEEIFK